MSLHTQADMINLELSSTVLNFAYVVHAMTNHSTKRPILMGKIMPLITKLDTGDKIEILTYKEPHSNLDWVNVGNSFIHSAKNSCACCALV